MGFKQAMRDSKVSQSVRDSLEQVSIWDSLVFDDFVNNLESWKNDVKGILLASSSNLQNVAFVSENTNSTNEVIIKLSHWIMEDLDQVDEYDLEEMGLKMQDDEKELTGNSFRRDEYLLSMARKRQDQTHRREQLSDVGVEITRLILQGLEVRSTVSLPIQQDNPHRTLKNKGIINSGCSRHMTGKGLTLLTLRLNGGLVALESISISSSVTNVVTQNQGSVYDSEDFKFTKRNANEEALKLSGRILNKKLETWLLKRAAKSSKLYQERNRSDGCLCTDIRKDENERGVRLSGNKARLLSGASGKKEGKQRIDYDEFLLLWLGLIERP
ncbi:hypothetical protein Tco_1042386 [Tanacetum coccineum]|uniref:Uncharacterized protein n=1 Tax=Tanacetum coccineum TaxID=301880 RepID=A0ABQ5GIY3_9ASTR